MVLASASLKPKTLTAIDLMAERKGITRSEFIRRVMEAFVENNRIEEDEEYLVKLIYLTKAQCSFTKEEEEDMEEAKRRLRYVRRKSDIKRNR